MMLARVGATMLIFVFSSAVGQGSREQDLRGHLFTSRMIAEVVVDVNANSNSASGGLSQSCRRNIQENVPPNPRGSRCPLEASVVISQDVIRDSVHNVRVTRS